MSGRRSGCPPGASRRTSRDRAPRHGVRLPRRLGLPGRRLPARVQPALEPHSLALPNLLYRTGPPASRSTTRSPRCAPRSTRSAACTGAGRCAASTSWTGSRPGTTSGWRTPIVTRSGGRSRPQERYGSTAVPRAEHRRLVRHLRRRAPTATSRACARTARPRKRARPAADRRSVVARHRRGIFRSATTGPRRRFDAQDPTGLHLRFFDRWLKGTTDRPSTTTRRRALPHGRERVAARDRLAAAGRRDPALVPARRRAARTRVGRRRLSPEPPGRRDRPMRSSTTRATPSRARRRDAQPGRHDRLELGPVATSGPSSAAPTCSSTRPRRCAAARVIGPVEAVVFVSSVRARHRLHRKLVDVHPDGRRRDPDRRDPAPAVPPLAREPEPARARRRRRARSRSWSAPRRTGSWPAIGSGSTSRAATSRASTPTRTPAARSPTKAPRTSWSRRSTASSTTRADPSHLLLPIVERA